MTPRETVGLKDVAEKLGISISTASRALSEANAGRVSPELRSRVLLVARQLGYSPHPAAQLLRKPKTHIVTALLPLSTDSFISDYMNGILAGVVTAARDLELEVRVTLLDASDNDILRQATQASIGAGSILLIGKLLTLRQVVKLEELSRPIVVLDACLPPNTDLREIAVSTIGMNNRECFYDMTVELLKLGHRRIALVNGPEHMHDAAERLQGYVQALTEYRQPIDHQAIVSESFSTDGGVHGWETLAQRSVRPTAIMCGSDEIAFGVLDKLADEKILCPRDISVVGFDDSRLAARISPSLTTVRQPTIEIGRAAIQMLNERFGKAPGELTIEHRILPGTIMRRESVAPPSVKS